MQNSCHGPSIPPRRPQQLSLLAWLDALSPTDLSAGSGRQAPPPVGGMAAPAAPEGELGRLKAQQVGAGRARARRARASARRLVLFAGRAESAAVALSDLAEPGALGGGPGSPSPDDREGDMPRRRDGRGAGPWELLERNSSPPAPKPSSPEEAPEAGGTKGARVKRVIAHEGGAAALLEAWAARSRPAALPPPPGAAPSPPAEAEAGAPTPTQADRKDGGDALGGAGAAGERLLPERPARSFTQSESDAGPAFEWKDGADAFGDDDAAALAPAGEAFGSPAEDGYFLGAFEGYEPASDSDGELLFADAGLESLGGIPGLSALDGADDALQGLLQAARGPGPAGLLLADGDRFTVELPPHPFGA